MSLVDYASSSDDDVPEPTGEEHKKEEGPQLPQRDSPPSQPPPSRVFTKSGSSSNRPPENKPHPSAPSVEKLPDASLLLSSPAVSSDLMNARDHSSRVAVALAENASRKRDSNGMASAVRSKVPKGNLPHSRNVPETAGRMLLPPQISGRKNVVTEDVSKLFVKKHCEHSSS